MFRISHFMQLLADAERGGAMPLARAAQAAPARW